MLTSGLFLITVQISVVWAELCTQFRLNIWGVGLVFRNMAERDLSLSNNKAKVEEMLLYPCNKPKIFFLTRFRDGEVTSGL